MRWDSTKQTVDLGSKRVVDRFLPIPTTLPNSSSEYETRWMETSKIMQKYERIDDHDEWWTQWVDSAWAD